MASRISELVIPSLDPRRLAAFWCEVLDFTVLELRMHFDVNATDRDQDAELERLLKVGARRVDIGQTGEESWHCLADPEGNEFCLLRTRLS
ncbi:VOC family protein [Amycolatopsis cynarae]|uniref:VOC family protein n=1 Tax=Amycolatopsis cynarae TaxID=2995223 RepID=A0ABY7B6N9_9PSEU|nr:VOC family protein [Amycolatopsis sp. HUAS 11-8]WAL67980.1 VOC family protein [Amycolatopsis sp. HUAS 11-8]